MYRISLAVHNRTIASNGTATITLSTAPGTDSFNGSDAVREVKAESLNPDAARAVYNNDGTVTVTGVAPGTADIKVTAKLYATDIAGIGNDGGYVADAKDCEFVLTVTVTDEVKLESISLPETETVEVGKTKPLAITYVPEKTTNTAVTWESLNPNIATVDANGIVTGVAEGTATITATPADTSMGAVTAQCLVTVTKAAEETPGTDPTDPGTDPTGPSTDPTDPGTDDKPAQPSGGGSGGGCSAGFGALALLAAVPLLLRRKK